MRFDDRVTGNLKNYAPKAKKIHVEIDPAEVNKNVNVDVALIGDVSRDPRRADPAGEPEATGASGAPSSTRSEGTRPSATSSPSAHEGRCTPPT